MSDAEITLLVDERGLTLEVHDKASGECVIDIELPPKELCQALGRLVRIPCKVRYGELDRVGKTMEHKSITFPMPHYVWSDRDKVAREVCKKYVPEGWVSDNYFGSQGSFFEKDGVTHARCTVRRWVS